MVEKAHRCYSPNRVLMLKDIGKQGEDLSKIAPLTEPISSGENGPIAYLCENFTCRNPVGDPSELESILAES